MTRPETSNGNSGLKMRSETPNIEISQYTGSEMELYIDRQFKDEEISQGDQTENSERKNLIKDRICELAHGSFHNAQWGIDKVKEIFEDDDHEELDKFIKGIGLNADSLMREELSKMQKDLSVQEIEELNELLIWIEYGRYYFQVDDLSPILSLRTPKPPLQPLRKKIVGKYPAVLEFFEKGFGSDAVEYVRVVGDMIGVIDKSRKESIATKEPPSITATIQITNASLETTRQFFWDLTGYMNDHTKVPFNFEGDLHPLQTKDAKIRLNEMDAYFVIVKRILEFLSREPHELSAPAGPYLVGPLPDYLDDLLSKAKEESPPLSDQDKQWIVEKLNSLFFDTSTILRHWGSFSRTTDYWNDDSMTQIWAWLEDGKAVDALGLRDKQWINERRVSKHRNRLLLKPIAEVAAIKWLRERDEPAAQGFYWIKAFLSLGSSAASKNLDADDPDDREGDAQAQGLITDWDLMTISIETTDRDAILQSEKWCRQFLDSRDHPRDALWVERLAETCCELQLNTECLENYRKALDILEDENKTEDDKTEDVSRKHNDIRVRLLIRLAHLESDSKAAEYGQRAFELDPSKPETNYLAFKSCLLRGDIESSKKWISMSLPNGEDADSPMLKYIMTSVMREDPQENFDKDSTTMKLFIKIASTCASTAETFDSLTKSIDLAVQDCQREGNYQGLAFLYLCKGIAFFHYGPRENTDSQLLAVKAWEDCSSVARNKLSKSSYQRKLLLNVNKHLSLYYFQQDNERTIEELMNIMDTEASLGTFGLSSASVYLAAFHCRNGRRDEARSLLKDVMSNALRKLSDDIADNDGEAYYLLSLALRYSGANNLQEAGYSLQAQAILNKKILAEWLRDQGCSEEAIAETICACPSEDAFGHNSVKNYLNAVKLCAHNLAEGERVTTAMDTYWVKLYHESFEVFCDGCQCVLLRECTAFRCKFCLDIDLCKSCVDRIEAEEIMLGVCHPNHERIEQPVWSDEEQLLALKKQLTLQSDIEGCGKKGEIIPASKFLNYLRDDWGFSKEDFVFD